MSIARWNLKGPAEKYRAVVNGETHDKPVSQWWARSSLSNGGEGALIHPTYTKVFADSTVRKNNARPRENWQSFRVAPE